MLGQHNLAYLYFVGEGVAQDRCEAFNWATLAAKQGFAAALFSSRLGYHVMSRRKR